MKKFYTIIAHWTLKQYVYFCHSFVLHVSILKIIFTFQRFLFKDFNTHFNIMKLMMMRKIIIIVVVVVVVVVVIVIAIVVLIIVISFMQGTYIPETNYVPREHGVAAILLFLFMVLISLLSVLNLLYFTLVLSEVCVQCPTRLFSVVPWLHGFLVCCSRIFWMT